MSNTERKTITVSQVIALLDEGYQRPQIAEKLGITKSDVTKLFKNPALKGKKAKKAPGFVLIDDTDTPESELARRELEVELGHTEAQEDLENTVEPVENDVEIEDTDSEETGELPFSGNTWNN